MNSKIRNLTLTAAALAALTVIAPTASAAPWKHFPLPPSPHEVREMWQSRHGRAPEFRGNSWREHEWREHEWREHAYVAPRPVYRRGYARYGYAAPYRVFSGFRFYSAYPGPSYVYVANCGWVVPPFFGAVWVPGHYDIEGFWVDGYWR